MVDNQAGNLINNNQYFSEAWGWYCDKYLKPITEQVWLSILLIVSITCLAIHITSVYFFFPLTNSLPFVTYVEKNNDNLHIIKKISSKHSENPQIALAEYLVGYYVKLREEYDYHNLSQQKKQTKANSSRTVYNNFLNYLDVHNNPESPILEYKKDGKQVIKISNVTIYGSGAGTSSAKVAFISSNNQTKVIKERNVMLRFTLSDMASSLKSIPLEFRVVSYEQ